MAYSQRSINRRGRPEALSARAPYGATLVDLAEVRGSLHFECGAERDPPVTFDD